MASASPILRFGSLPLVAISGEGVFRRAIPALCFICFWLAVSAVNAELPTDRLLRSLQPSADVNDFADILKPAEEAAIESRCRQLREKTGAQLAVVTLKSLEGGQIDDFAVKLFERWGIGQKDRKNGVLLLVAVEDRKARIEVGYGLEPILPDALAGRILNDELFPAFKQQRYEDGLSAAVNRIAAIVEKNEPAPKNLQQPGRLNSQLPVVAILTLFVAMGSFVLGSNFTKLSCGQIAFSCLSIGIPFLMGLVAAFPLAPIVHIPMALVFGWLGWRARQYGLSAGGNSRRTRTSRSWPTGSSWNFPMGNSGWGGGGFSGGGGSWGGFGGGRSGGGGASGSW
jgi:uncharacterized protein